MQIGHGKEEINNSQSFSGRSLCAVSDLLTGLFYFNVVCFPRHQAMRKNRADIQFRLLDAGH